MFTLGSIFHPDNNKRLVLICQELEVDNNLLLFYNLIIHSALGSDLNANIVIRGRLRKKPRN